MNESDLADVLDRATDRVESPDLGRDAWATARRRVAAGRAAAGAAAAVLVVAAVVATLGTGQPDADPAQDPASPPSPGLPMADAGPATQPRWDPFTVADAPVRSATLPARLAPPAAPDPLIPGQDPMPGVVVAWPQEGADLRLLGTDGRWRSVAGTRDAVRGTLRDVVDPAISADGTLVVMGTSAGIRVVDVTSGEDRTIGWPREVAPPWDTVPTVRWQPGDDGFLVLHWNRTWLVDLDGGDQEAPFRRGYVSLAVDPDGPVYQNDYDLRRLLTWQGNQVVHDAPFHQCERMVAAHGLLACTTGSLQPLRSGPVVTDPVTGEVVAYAPIKDRSSVYSDNGHLTALGFLDEETVLLLVGPADFRTMDIGEESWHLVAWTFGTGTLERLTSGDTDMRSIAVAPGLVD